MTRRTRSRVLALVPVLLAMGSCAKVAPLVSPPNQPPTITLTSAPAPGSTIGNYSYDIRWAARDVDGHIDHYVFAVDPPAHSGSDTAWTATTLNRRVFVFSADSLPSESSLYARRFHTVVVKAVDDRGAMSAPAWISFTATTVLPTLKVTSPQASKLLLPTVAPDFRVSWIADDPDGRLTRTPATFKYKLFGQSSVPGRLDIQLNPDTLLKLFAPRFADWDSLPGSATGVDIRGLQAGQTYVLAVVAFDEAGACSAPFTLDSNILTFSTSNAALVGPVLTITSPFFTLTYGAGGFFSAANQYFHVEVPAERETVLDWSGAPSAGSFITGYRWAVDLGSLSDETPRTDESTDLKHWSQWHADTQARLPAVHPGLESASHFFYLEARDNSGGLSLLVVVYTAITASMERDLLIVDDTRFPKDVKSGACVLAPRGPWPTASELDTFLFARGGKPWKCYPAGTVSTPGMFAGYSYDSLVTSGRGANLTLTKLNHYRHIVWMVNGDFVLTHDVNLQYPMLRLLSAPGVNSPLPVWLALGGKLWVMGGGVATATQIDWEAKLSKSNVYSSELGELTPARFMYRFPSWQSEITEDRTARAVLSPRAVGGWPGAPDYALLPPQLEEKSADTDPMAPNRTNPTDFYRSNYIAEFLTKPNTILERDPVTRETVSTLDTLYETLGGAAGSGRPVMTLYHGPGSPGVVFSGFPVWYFKRPQGIAVIDWVLQSYWGLSRAPVPR